jgi:1,4-alpha-glucan branching enzyme
MKTGTSVEYAHNRIRDNLARFHYLCDAVEAGSVDEGRLAALETMDAIFPDLDFRIYTQGDASS